MLGRPIGHSLSPLLHRAAYAELGLSWTYDAIDCGVDDLPGVLAEREFRRWVIAPTLRIAAALKARHPGVPLIGFPRGAGGLLPDYAVETRVSCVGLDTQVPLAWAMKALPPGLPVQGNLDPVALVTGGEALSAGIRTILEQTMGRPLIFNLGHGVPMTTPPDHVAELVRLVRQR